MKKNELPKKLNCEKCNKPTTSQYLSKNKRNWFCWECSKEEDNGESNSWKKIMA